VFVEPAVAGGVVYVGSCSGTYFALDAESGEPRWSVDMSPPGGTTTFHSNPVLVGDLIITSTDGESDGTIYALEKNSGVVRWARALEEGQVVSDLRQSHGQLYALTRAGTLVALDLQDGSTRWIVRAARDLHESRGSVLVEDDVVYLGGLDEHVYAIRPQDGSIVWTRDLGAHVSTSLALRGGSLYAGTGDDRLHRLDASTGASLATFTLPEDPGGKLLATESSIVVLGHEPSSFVAALDPELQGIVWTAPERPWNTIRPVVWRERLILGDTEGSLVGLDVRTGAVVWEDVLRGRLRGLGHTPETLYVGSTAGRLFAYRAVGPGISVE